MYQVLCHVLNTSMELYAGRLMWWTAGRRGIGTWIWKYSGKPVADFVWYQGKKPRETTENYLCLDSFNNYNQSVIVGSDCSDTKFAFPICQRHKNRN